MRAFIAIELSEGIKDLLSRLQDRLKISGADVKWVKPDNIHLTLRFLGEINQEQLDGITQILNYIGKDKQVFTIRIASIGAFPQRGYPRVIWVGIDKGDAQIKQLVKELEEKITKIGIPAQDRPFSSHITIGRVRSALNRERLVNCLNNLAIDSSEEIRELTATKITLFKSTLTPKGPIYEIIHNANLKAT